MPWQVAIGIAVGIVAILNVVRHAIRRDAEATPPSGRAEALAKAERLNGRIFAIQFVLMAFVLAVCVLSYFGAVRLVP
jgi:hypothetical protein